MSVQSIPGPPNPHMAAGFQNGVDLNHEANAQHRQGNYERAAELHRQALQKKLDSVGPHNVSTAFSYNGLAEALIKLNKLDEAEQNTLKALEIVVAVGDKFNQAYYRETLAIIHEMRGDLAKANDVRLEGKPDHIFCAYYQVRTLNILKHAVD